MLFLALTTAEAQTNLTKIGNELYSKLLENQKAPFIEADEEVFVINETVWQRKYGENEYVLTPEIPNIKDYNKRIRQLDNTESNKSKYYFIKIEVTELSRSLLNTASIHLPSYVEGQVLVYLPEIDIDVLEKAGINVNYQREYGVKSKLKDGYIQKNQTPAAVIYNEDFETVPATIPGSIYSATIAGVTNCGWKDVSCIAHTSTWSAWCAGNGAACNACGLDYKDNMDSQFWKTNTINTSSYTNLSFNWWMNYDFNNTGTNDILSKYWWSGTSWVVSPTSYNSSSTNDGGGWVLHTATFTGTLAVFDYLFQFTSNSIGTSFGVYIDDIQLTGNSVATGINEENSSLSNIKISPNPNNGEFYISTSEDIILTITNELGQKVKTILLTDKNKHQVQVSDLPSGIYFINGMNEKEFIKEKVVITK